MQRERWLWCGTISGAIKQHTFLIASASNKSLPISRTKKPKNGVAIRVGRPSTNPLRLHHDELRVVIIACHISNLTIARTGRNSYARERAGISLCHSARDRVSLGWRADHLTLIDNKVVKRDLH